MKEIRFWLLAIRFWLLRKLAGRDYAVFERVQHLPTSFVTLAGDSFNETT